MQSIKELRRNFRNQFSTNVERIARPSKLAILP